MRIQGHDLVLVHDLLSTRTPEVATLARWQDRHAKSPVPRKDRGTCVDGMRDAACLKRHGHLGQAVEDCG